MTIKAITHYLTAAGITDPAAVAAATNALQALQADAQSDISTAQTAAQQAREQVQGEIRENQQARALAASFRKVADAAKVDISALNDTGISAERRRELSEQFGKQVLDFLTDAGSTAGDTSAILRAAGFDLDAYQKAGKEKRAEMAKAFSDGIVSDRAALKKAGNDKLLGEAKLDAVKVGKIIGDVVLVKGKTTVKDATGKDVEVDTVGTLDDKGAFTPISKTLSEAGWTMQELAPRKGGNTQGSGAGTEQQGGWLLSGGQTPANAGGQGGDLLDFLNPKPADSGDKK